MKQYLDLVSHVLNTGNEKGERTGTGTKSVFGHQMRFDLSLGFPMVTTKKLHLKSIIYELLWFLKGDTNTDYLTENGVKIWNAWADENGNLGPVYGHQWRNWNSDEIDQITEVIETLKTNPDSRRLMVSAWNVGELNHMILPPCHYGFQVYTRELTGEERWDLLRKKVGEERFQLMVDDIVPFGGGLSEELQSYNIPKRAISLMWNQRSCDVPLGIPMNIASYGLLLMMIADEVNMIPEELIGNLGDCHIYLNQMEGVKEQIGREPFELPTVYVRDGIHCSSVNDVILENYQSHPKIYFPLSN